MPQSRTRYQRAAKRSRYRKPKRKRGGSFGWNVAIAVIVIAGVVGVFLVRSSTNSAGSGPPHVADQAANQAGDHWHTALDVNVCGEWLDNPPAFEKPFDSPNQATNAGIHSHGDGLIHTHPFVVSESGDNATIGKFFSYGGWGLSSDSIDLGGANSAHVQWKGPASDPKKTTWSTGDVCPFGQYKGQKVQMTWEVDGKVQSGNPASYHQQDGQTVAIYFLPKGADKPFPDQACSAFAAVSSVDSGLGVLSKKSPCRAIESTTTTTPGGTTTTVPAGTSTSTP
jgi:hypothetical protein